MNKPFSLNQDKDRLLIGTVYTLKNVEEGKELKGKFVSIDKEGRYTFNITTKNSQYESFETRLPNNGDINETIPSRVSATSID